LHVANSSGVNGASDAPKSTVRFVIALIPPPEPIGEYVTLIPRDESTFGIHVWTSFDTNVLPAPVKLPAFAFELDAPAPMTAASATATSTGSAMMSFLVKLFSSSGPIRDLIGPSMPPASDGVGRWKVSFW
jgi:hypothetical protein